SSRAPDAPQSPPPSSPLRPSPPPPRHLHSFPTRRSSDLSSASASSRAACSSSTLGPPAAPPRAWVAPSTSPSVVTATSSGSVVRSEEHTSELQSRFDLVCRLLLEKKNQQR